MAYKCKTNLVNKKFGRLLVISLSDPILLKCGKNKTMWNCLCDCGKSVIISGCALITNNTKSCGCLAQEYKCKKGKIRKTKLDPIMFSAKSVWWATYKEDNGISFEDFYEKSQQNCFYCGVAPNRKYNYFKNRENSYAYKLNPIFVYNGLDRINSNENHNINNVVPCCYICNRAKRNKPINVFKEHILRIINNSCCDINTFKKCSDNIVVPDLNKKFFGSTVKCTFSDHYNDGLSIEQFYKLSQLNCYYCGAPPSNIANKNKVKNVEGIFVYNGLDRIDNTLPHTYDNVVTCCYDCNFAKSNITLTDFLFWINSLKQYYPKLMECKLWVD